MDPKPTNSDLNTPRQNSSLENAEEGLEIEVTDPKHPLFGRRFSVILMGRGPIDKSCVNVHFKESTILQIPVRSTNLGQQEFNLSTKLSLESIKSIIQFFKDSKELCHINLNTSIKTYPLPSRRKLGKKS